MQSDVKSTRVTASGTIFAGPGRVRGVYIVSGATAGSVIIKDGGSGGTTVLTIDTPASATVPIWVEIPDKGILCSTSVYATVSNAGFVTVFYS